MSIILFWSFSNSPSFFKQILTNLDLSDNQIECQGAEHLANALRNNMVTRIPPYFTLIRILIVSYRHWLNSIFIKIKLETRVHSTSLMYCERTRWFLLFLHASSIQCVFFKQILTELDLGYNFIGDHGGQLLADALRENTVILIYTSFYRYSLHLCK